MNILVAIEPSSSRALIDRITALPWGPDDVFMLMTVAQEGILGSFRASEGQHFIIDCSAELRRRLGNRVLAAECLVGDPVPSILERSASWRADLVIVGCHNKTGLERAILGSVSQAVLEHSHCPVLIIHRAEIGDIAPFARILIALDGSDVSNHALTWLSQQSWVGAGKLCFASVVPAMSGAYGSGRTSIEEALSELEKHAEQARAAADEIAFHIETYGGTLANVDHEIKIISGNPEKEILHLVHEWQPDLVVLGSHGHSGLSKILLGSVSLGVASKSPQSVLVVKPPLSAPVHTASDDYEFSQPEDRADWIPHNAPPMR